MLAKNAALAHRYGAHALVIVLVATLGCSSDGERESPPVASAPTAPVFANQDPATVPPGPGANDMPAAVTPPQTPPDPAPNVPDPSQPDPVADPMQQDPSAMQPSQDPTMPVDDPDPMMPDDVDDGPLNMAPVTFGPNVAISEGSGQATEVVMEAGEGGLIFVGWMGGRRCNFSVSKDGGQTWSTPHTAATQASSRSAFAGDPAVAIDDVGNLYAGCQDYASGGLGTNYVLLAHSTDQGASWSDFERVNQSLDKPWLGATEDGVVMLSWLGRPGGIKRSEDYGASWADTISLGYINHGTIIAVAPETGLVHMAYNTGEDTVTYRRSKDRGVSFESARDLAAQGRPCRSPCSPRSHPIVGGGTDPTGQVVAITWAATLSHPDGEGDDDVWVIVSYDGGDTFSDPIRVNDNMNPSRQFQSWAAVDKYGAVHVVWTDLRDNGQNATYYARMTDIDAGFEANVEVTDGTGRPASFLGDYKGIDIQGRDVVITWTDTRNNSAGDIYFARAADAAAAGGPLMP